jgi:hypothetical protein
MGHRYSLDVVVNRKNPHSCWKLSSGQPAPSLVTIQTHKIITLYSIKLFARQPHYFMRNQTSNVEKMENETKILCEPTVELKSQPGKIVKCSAELPVLLQQQ